MLRIMMLACLLVGLGGGVAQAAQDGWTALKAGGVVALIRHTSAPDTGQEFTNVRLDDCSTQRLLSERGRREAEVLGNMYRRAGVDVGRVLSSEWCRCLSTARLAFGDGVEPYRALNTFHNVPSREPGQSAELRQLIRAQAARADVLAMVTHWQNIQALVGFKPREGESIVVGTVDNGQIVVFGRIPPPRA